MMQPDSTSYEEPAKALLKTGQFLEHIDNPDQPMLVRTPGYPTFIAAIYGLFGESRFAVILFQIFVSCLSILLLHGIAAKWCDRRTALMVTLLYALDPASTLISQFMLTETLFTFFWLLCVLLGVQMLRHSRKISWPLLLGILLATTTLIRPVSYYLILPITVFMGVEAVRSRYGWRQALTILLLIWVPCVLVLSAWQLRNKSVSGCAEFSTIKNANLLFYKGAGIVARRDGISFSEAQAKLRQRSRGAAATSIAERDSIYKQEALELFRSHPVLLIRNLLIGLSKLILSPSATTSWYIYLGMSEASSPIMDLGRLSPLAYIQKWPLGKPLPFLSLAFDILHLGFLYLCAVYGAYIILRRRHHVSLPEYLFVCIFLAYLAAVSSGPETYFRFRVPLMPLLCLIAGIGVSQLRHVKFAGKVSGSDRKRRLKPAGSRE
jgi:4-amino-4-deoxy-L-arabinose transferase-like glycosyltransferase